MTVRWKPLIVLSGLFLVIAVLGLMAITFELVPGKSADILPLARQEWKAGRYAHAKIQFQRALQQDGKNAQIHEEMARMLADWAEHEPKMRAQLHLERLSALADAAKYDKRDVEPRRLLLIDALEHEDTNESVPRAKQVLDLDPADPDAHYALALEALDLGTPDLVEAGRHLKALEAREPKRLRTEWVRARIARESSEDESLETVLARVRTQSLPAEASMIDRMAMLRLRQLDAITTTDPATLAERVEAIRAEAESLSKDGTIAPERLARIGRLLEQVQKHVSLVSANVGAEKTVEATKAGEALDALAEANFQKALTDSKAADLAVYEEYAEYLLFREERERCLEMAAKGLKLDAAKLPIWTETVMRLREIAIRAALSDPEDPDRHAKAAPYISDLLQARAANHKALGHLFQGIIDLERSGLAEATRVPGTVVKETDPKLRASALEHLKTAALVLDAAMPQALYGVALMLSGETALGRQYLQKAQQHTNLEPRYQVWAAWAMVQGGYPEEAEPTVAALLAGIAKGEVDRSLEPTLYLIDGEIHQAKHTPEELSKALNSFQKAITAGQEATPALQLRMAQIEILLGHREQGMKRIDALKSQAEGGPAADHLAVLTLSDQGKTAEARKLLSESRKRFPDSDELAGLDAALSLKEGKPEEADRILTEFLKAYPENINVIQARAELLAGTLNKPEEARTLLAKAAEGAENSSPLVQLALLDLARRDFASVERSIATIRERWSEAAAADLLDAQLDIARNNPRSAAEHLDAALVKDPGNKVALFWKAQLNSNAGDPKEAMRIYEEIRQAQPSKELEDGLSLSDAADWALATLALENQDPDAAIQRLQGLLQSGQLGDKARMVRWQMVSAQNAKGEWPTARKEIESLLKDLPKDSKERNEELVRAANFYRVNGENARASSLLDHVLQSSPGYSPAVAMRSFLMAQDQPPQAAALLRKAIASGDQPPSIHLMLSAIENTIPPADTGLTRALAVIDNGLKEHPSSIELVQARYRVLQMSGKADEALAYIQEKAQDDPNGVFRRLLVDTLHDVGRYAEAETIVRDLLAKDPKDASLAAMLVRLVASQAATAAAQGDPSAERKFNEKTATLIREFRAKFPDDVVFPQAEAELAARAGQLDRALALTAEIDQIDKNSPVGPMLRAQIAAARGWAEGVAKEYSEAVSRAPKRTDIRLALAQASLASGDLDEAVRQADWLLESKSAEPAALIVKARALAHQDGTPSQVAARRDEAVQLLRSILQSNPKFSGAYHQIADIQMMSDQRGPAVQTLTDALKAVPNDATSLAMLVQYLCSPRGEGQPAPAKEIEQAQALVSQYAGADKTGEMALAAAIGFHKAGQTDLGLAWIEKAAPVLDSWVLHLNYGDMLLEQGRDRRGLRLVSQPVRTGGRSVRCGSEDPAELGRGGEQQGVDPAPVPRQEPGCPGPGGGFAQTGRSGDLAARLLRHARLDPGGIEAHSRCGEVLHERAEPGGGASRAEFPHGTVARQ